MRPGHEMKRDGGSELPGTGLHSDSALHPAGGLVY